MKSKEHKTPLLNQVLDEGPEPAMAEEKKEENQVEDSNEMCESFQDTEEFELQQAL